ncbi:MAG: 50S ribosomal protein L13 [Nanoarchaeota archaeon]|nr:50S ribosomal protein L13 [Nanoarchaeota archaeon]
MIINAEHEVVGRIATRAAKAALEGEKVDIVNCEKAVITGNKKAIIQFYKDKVAKGDPLQGPYWQKRPDKFTRRIVRGMLPWKKSRGQEAFRRVMCYIGIPEEFKDKKIISIDAADVSKTHNLKFITIGDLCKQLRGKW